MLILITLLLFQLYFPVFLTFSEERDDCDVLHCVCSIIVCYCTAHVGDSYVIMGCTYIRCMHVIIISLQQSSYCDSELFCEIHIFMVYWSLSGCVLFNTTQHTQLVLVLLLPMFIVLLEKYLFKYFYNCI